MEAVDSFSAADVALTILSTMRVELAMFALAGVTFLLVSARRGGSIRQAKCVDEEPADLQTATPKEQHGDSRAQDKSAERVLLPSYLTVPAVLVIVASAAAVCLWLGPLKHVSIMMLTKGLGAGSGEAMLSSSQKASSQVFEDSTTGGSDDLSYCDEDRLPRDVEPTVVQLRRDMRCHRRLIQSSPKRPAPIIGAVKKLLPSVEALVVNCGSLTKQMEALQVVRSKVNELSPGLSAADPVAVLAQHAITLFQQLRDLHFPFQDAIAALDRSVMTMQAVPSSRTSEVLYELENIRTVARECLLKAMREARVLAMVFQHAEPQPQKPLECDSMLLAGVEDFAIVAAKAEEDDNADTHWDLAMYWSIVSVAEGGTPCFRDSLSGRKSARDERGLFVPGDVVEAETMLRSAEENTYDAFRPERAAQRAHRLQEHANFLSWSGNDAASEWRFRAAASLAAEHQQPKLAAHSLGRLGAMLLLRSRQRDALAAADEALSHFEDPLALYLQTSLRLKFGEFPTGASVRTAAKQLQTLAGQLPWEALETERAALESDLALWDAVAEGDVKKCLWLGDVAKVLICMGGWLAF